MNFQSFEYYLQDKGLAQRTISEHLKDLVRFEAWTKENGIEEITHLTYNELLGYVQSMKSKALSVQTLNIRINSIRKYFEHLKDEGAMEINPARRLRIKGAIKNVIVNPLSHTELENLYQEYAKPRERYREEKHKAVHQRNVVILGLMIGQAVHSGELDKIEINHVKLNEGMIYIPSTRRSNSRELKLESRQIILLHRYITESKFTSEKLFECHPSNTMQYLSNELKGINPVIKNAGHIRASVILNWIKMYDKRQVQYMAGHKWISSTEHYEVQELTGLTDLLTKHHPFS
ncbi:MAG: site-specific integrase [Bacteroidetes bacterium]|nr:site-specific integrase [Bacteroidota bacterium]